MKARQQILWLETVLVFVHNKFHIHPSSFLFFFFITLSTELFEPRLPDLPVLF